VVLKFGREIYFAVPEDVLESLADEVFLACAHHEAEDVQPLVEIDCFGVAGFEED
jgi:hypothetical protein